ncbi:MAG: hypothetical protein sL5_04330 [Candidatus Mesenet longicola]|uniref:Uncharacterized protein n=1 Tax=Candidatus Mesenet longicola TaxID=1892558 RepID=A0A8J3HV29_9RICK|nr:MAG: hypothetical protein sGL2_04430 [Candidatus Mesenet longicola]GHM59440.1 MAG: hypothetical protein sL5_04330 [Candidatus Mesenet longicola]
MVLRACPQNQGMCISILHSTWMRRKYPTDLKDREWGIDRKVFKGIV